MTMITDPWDIIYPVESDPISPNVFMSMAQGMNAGLSSLDRISVASGVMQANKDLTASNVRVSMLNTSPGIGPVKESGGISLTGGSFYIPAGWTVLMFGSLSGEQFSPGQNVGFDLYHGSSYTSMTTNDVVASGVAGASANGFLNAIVPPVIIPAESYGRYAFLAARSTGGGGMLKGSTDYGNSTVLIAIGFKTA